ncbi:MAG: hypothetical protein ACKVHL_03235 [Rhodospirillales bacterium]|jgi:hypothetical protein
MKLMWGRVVVLSVPLVIAACAAEQEVSREVTRAVFEEPRYCYRHFVGRDGIRCFTEPVHRDERHLVGFTGPPPSHYKRPPVKLTPKLHAPAAVSYWVKDPELLPEPAPVPPGRRVAPPPVRPIIAPSAAPSAFSAPISRPVEQDRFPIKKPFKRTSKVLIEPLNEPLIKPLRDEQQVSSGSLAPSEQSVLIAPSAF